MKGFLRKVIVLGVSFQFVFCALSFASETNRAQGLVMAVDAKNQTVIVNEKLFRCDGNSKIRNAEGVSIGLDQINHKMRVEIEWVEDNPRAPLIIKTLSIVNERAGKRVKHPRPGTY